MPEMTCKKCSKTYILGRTGTIESCDACGGIVRNNIDHTIIPIDMTNDFDRAFIAKLRAECEEDSLTDMEKA